MKPRKTLPTDGLVGIAMHVLLCLFISSGEVIGCQQDRSQMVALEVLPLWVVVTVVLGCPLLVLARLKWGPSPWDIQSRKLSKQVLGQNE